MRAFRGTLHANPDYALWYGWSERVRDLAEIKEMGEELRGKQDAKTAVLGGGGKTLDARQPCDWHSVREVFWI